MVSKPGSGCRMTTAGFGWALIWTEDFVSGGSASPDLAPEGMGFALPLSHKVDFTTDFF
jgi:hypothetical protein